MMSEGCDWLVQECNVGHWSICCTWLRQFVWQYNRNFRNWSRMFLFFLNSEVDLTFFNPLFKELFEFWVCSLWVFDCHDAMLTWTANMDCNKEVDIADRSEKWSHCRSALNLHSFYLPAVGESTGYRKKPISVDVYEKRTLILTWFITSVKDFLMATWSQSPLSSLLYSVTMLILQITVSFKKKKTDVKSRVCFVVWPPCEAATTC